MSNAARESNVFEDGRMAREAGLTLGEIHNLFGFLEFMTSSVRKATFGRYQGARQDGAWAYESFRILSMPSV
jgi:hypothetical protein